MDRTLDIGSGWIVSFRQGTLYDLEAVLDIDESLFPSRLSYDAETFLFCFMDHQTSVIVAQLENEMVGFLIFRPQSDDTGCVVSIDVVKKFQGNGIGSALLEIAESISRKKKHLLMVLQTQVDNQKTIQFYQKRGYEKTHRIHDYYQDGTSAWEMEKLF